MFRQAALDHRHRKQSPIIIATPPSSRVAAVCAVALSCTVVVATISLHLTRTVTAPGVLVAPPMRIYATQTGTITQKFAKNGDVVRAGQPLVTISSDPSNSQLANMRANVSDTLRAKIQHQLSMVEATKNLQQQKREALVQRIADQRTKVETEQATLKRQQFLFGKRDVKIGDIDIAQVAVSTDHATLVDLEAQLAQTPAANQVELDSLLRDLSDMESDLAHNEMLREVTVAAPQDGVVSADIAVVGQTVTPAQAIMVVQSPTLEAHLALPAGARGFIQVGDTVRLRYEPFPYTKYGTFPGIVSDISSVALDVSEFESLKLATDGQPVYRVTVQIAQQSVVDDLGEHKLQSTMPLQAEIAQESRRLVDYAFEATYYLRNAPVQ